MSNRRTFIKNAGLASAGVLFSSITTNASYKNVFKTGQKVKLACIGIGNRGTEVINELYKTGLAHIVALCDVDMGAAHTQQIISKFPQAQKFKDFRIMFDKMQNQFDAVAVATPDHSHFAICMQALKACFGFSIFLITSSMKAIK